MRRFAVVGSPIAHSLSPLLHATAYRELGIEDAAYERHEVGAGELADFLAGPGQELSGLSVTMPGKPEAFALAAERDSTSEILGVANTLLRRPGVAALHDHGAGTPRRAAVLGSGATAASAVLALCRMGAEEILLSARSPEKLTPLATLASDQGARPVLVPWADAADLMSAEVAVSALAAPGARALAEDWSARSALPVVPLLLDVLYDPWPAPLAALLAARGSEVASGLEMLVHQADMQVRSMLAVASAPVAPMLAAAQQALRS